MEFIFDKHFVIHSGLCPIALGTDGGGSIRIPAAACGVVGIKGLVDMSDKNSGRSCDQFDRYGVWKKYL